MNWKTTRADSVSLRHSLSSGMCWWQLLRVPMHAWNLGVSECLLELRARIAAMCSESPFILPPPPSLYPALPPTPGSQPPRACPASERSSPGLAYWGGLVRCRPGGVLEKQNHRDLVWWAWCKVLTGPPPEHPVVSCRSKWDPVKVRGDSAGGITVMVKLGL